MAFVQADLDKLERAIADARGARQISFSDQMVIFNSLSEMKALRADMKREIDAATRQTYRLAVTNKGTG